MSRLPKKTYTLSCRVGRPQAATLSDRSRPLLGMEPMEGFEPPTS